MKKYLFNGAMALIVGGFIVSCSHDDISQPATVDQMTKSFDEMFTELYGPIAPNHNWGFATVGVSEEANDLTEDPMLTRANTRSNMVISGDPFTKYENTDRYYKSAIPSTAKTPNVDVNTLQGYTELKFENGTFGIHCWQGSRDIYVNGIVTMNVDNTNSLNQARIYLLPNSTLHFNMSAYINNLEIYVANGATLNYNAEKLYKQTGGGIIFNRGTLNVPDNFEINQDAIVYNEGTINGNNITSKPGDGHPSYFYNYGDLKLKGNMELNSCANFFNEGVVNVAGKTTATQAKIWWINKGHYTTGTLEFSAHNETFYNYCNLIVKGNTAFKDGIFHLMDNSYTETGTAVFGNSHFEVHMGNNSGINIKGNVSFGANGDGTDQGFFTTGTKAYVRVDGKATVAAHKYSFVVGGNIVCAIKDGIEDLGANNSGVQPTYEFKNGATVVDFNNLIVTPKTAGQGCGATWGGGNPNAYPETISIQKKIHKKIIDQGRVFCEDIATAYRQVKEDIDYNDIVFDARVWEIYDQYEVTYNNTVTPSAKTNWRYQYDICLLATGGTIAEKVGKDEVDVHNAFGVGQAFMVNTWTTNCPPTLSGQWNTPNNIMKAVDFSYTINKADQTDPTNVGISTIPITVKYDGTNGVKALNNRELQEEKDDEGKVISVRSSAPYKLCVPLGTAWPIERANIQSAYKNFSSYVSGKQEFWTNNIEQSNQYTFAPLSSIQNDKKTKDSPEEIVNDGNATSSTVMVVWDKAVSEQKTLRLYNFNFVNEQTLRFYGTGSFKVLDKNNQELFSVVFVGGSKDIKLTNYQASMLKENVTITSSSKFNLTKIVALDKF